jgi:hypothetical protein
MRVTRIFAVLVTIALTAAVAVARPAESADSADRPALTVSQVIDRFIERERDLVKAMRQYHPMVETYLQTVRPDEEFGNVPAGDRYFLGRLDMADGVQERFYTDFEKPGSSTKFLRSLDVTRHARRFFTMDFMPLGFSTMIFPDARGLDNNNYRFQFLRREFLGDVRCLVFEVTPKENSGRGRFLGRIWVEDKDFNIVRFNGVYAGSERSSIYFHMDSWRSNLQPGMWLPTDIYSEESANKTGAPKNMQFKAQIRLWGYNVKHGGRQEEFTQMLVEQSGKTVKDESEAAQDASPVSSLRQWQREAEENVIDRLEQAGLLAPAGQVDKILTTVVNNLEITNNLDIQPEVHCRVLLTAPLESFTIGHTIVISRGLLDVLPDEVSLAMVLSHELAHIARGDQLDTKYAFGDRMSFADEETYYQFAFQRSPNQEREADKRALELLKNSPYQDKLASAGLFLRQLAQRAVDIPNLTKPRLGNGLTEGANVVRMPELMNGAPELQMNKIDQVAALPLGGRVKVDPWDNRVEMRKSKTVQLQSAREKMPFEIAPVIPRLTRLNTMSTVATANGGSGN